MPDTVAHEYGHAITYYRWDASNLNSMIYQGESAALQENYSDIVSEAFGYYRTGSADWVFGTDDPYGPYRNLADPQDLENPRYPVPRPRPDSYYHPDFYCGEEDYGGVHYNANVLNEAAYLIAEGGEHNGCMISGIGIEKLEQIFYRAASVYYTVSENFNQAYHSILNACHDLYSGADCAQVERALKSVELDQLGLCADPTGSQRVSPCSPPTQVVGRHVFYNNSAFDGHDPAVNSQDQQAIPPDKSALLPGQWASLDHYTSYSRGINGVMIDVSQPIAVTAADFEFRVGNRSDLATWTAAPSPLDVHFDADSLRITIMWADGAIRNQWLEVRMKANDNTHLVVDDVFYFGNAVGETGDVPGDTLVDAYDVAGAAANPRDWGDPAPITDPYDFNRDGLVDAADVALAETYTTDPDTRLWLLDLREAGLPEVSVSVSPDSVLEGGTDSLIYTFTRSGSVDQPATITFRVTGTALYPADYSVSGAVSFTEQLGTVAFAAGSGTAELLV